MTEKANGSLFPFNCTTGSETPHQLQQVPRVIKNEWICENFRTNSFVFKSRAVKASSGHNSTLNQLNNIQPQINWDPFKYPRRRVSGLTVLEWSISIWTFTDFRLCHCMIGLILGCSGGRLRGVWWARSERPLRKWRQYDYSSVVWGKTTDFCRTIKFTVFFKIVLINGSPQTKTSINFFTLLADAAAPSTWIPVFLQILRQLMILSR